MKFNFRKIVPIVTGALLLGSTIGFAAGVAGQAVEYPSSFSDAVVVYGALSNNADAGAINVLKADLGKLTMSTTASVSDGHLVKKSSSVLNYGESFFDIDDKLDSTDMSSLLADGTYKDTKGTNDNEEDYTQSLVFTDNGNKLVFEANDDNNDKMGSYLKLTDNVEAFEYQLKFTTGPKYDDSDATELKEDFELTKLVILGDEWTITDAVNVTAGADKLTLMGGAARATMKTGETKSMTVDDMPYSIEVTVFSDKAEFVINGESLTIDSGATDELADGTVIGVTEISTSSKETVADQVSFYLGARKLVLDDGEEVNLNGVDVDGTLVSIGRDTTNDRLKNLTVSFTPEDDEWISMGQSWSDPVFGKFKFVFAALNQQAEDMIEVSTSANTGEMTLKNLGGDELVIKFFDDDATVFFGEDYNDAIITQDGVTSAAGGDLIVMENSLVNGTTLSACEGVKLLVADSDGEARIYELTDVDETDNKMTFTDEANANDYEVDYADGSNTVDVGLINNLVFNANETTGDINFTSFNNYGNGEFLIESEGIVDLDYNGGVYVTLYNSTGIAAGNKLGAFNVTLDADDDMVLDIDLAVAANYGEEVDGSDTMVGLDDQNYGAIFTWDDENDNSLSIVYPGDEPVDADMYVSPIAAVVSGAGNVATVTDAEVTSDIRSKDLVVVGGPAVNKIAAELLGLDKVDLTNNQGAASGMSVDSFVVKLFSGALVPDKVALLVAGYDAKDTLAAAKKLSAEQKLSEGTFTLGTTGTYALSA